MNFLNRLTGNTDEANDKEVGVGGWLASIKEKSKDLMEVYKRDIGEFASVVSKDTTEAVAKTRGTIEKSLANKTSGSDHKAKQLPKSRQSDCSKSNRVNPKLISLQNTKETFTNDPADHDAFACFLEGFDASKLSMEISDLLQDVESVRSYHDELVPEIVTYKLFWARYFFGAKSIADEEARKHKFLTAAQLFDDEDFKWDEDETASLPSNQAGFPASKSESKDSKEDQVEVPETDPVERDVHCEDQAPKSKQTDAGDAETSLFTSEPISKSEENFGDDKTDERFESDSETQKGNEKDMGDTTEGSQDVKDDLPSALLGKSTSTCIDGTCSANGSDESSGSTVFVSHEEVKREKAEVQESAEKDEKDDDWADWE
ncbi:hypothetical protein GUITHDRAFT_151816 [Guillardia theta CCMP2712]|uniref:BSD domain-containing protein n=1 Tax=Guillardia theta (strain CCMP2712) TaxID=905079 RepID=L1JI39_GUITC|nr:hypothetical protein GUITHDRAFT_151816 [Guillardia theta CCMP2712]EKX48193.1 hypothetical protein GUITHDRAFT_151816 [Guillardia theta CCMP2712]|eukprot:XP_005835173.1 hypothetical protein GUITHDRAFT_151816 [Guillardia theta CCMP2712]